MSPVYTNSRIVEPRRPLRHSTPRPSVTARCRPTTSQLQSAVKETLPDTAAAAKEGLERTFQQDSAIVAASDSTDAEVDAQRLDDTRGLATATPPTESLHATEKAAGPFHKFLSPAVRGMILLNLGAALFGSNQVIIKTSEELLSPTALNALRFSLAALCFVPLVPRALRTVPLPSAMELGCWLTLGYTFQAFGLSMTSASHGAFTGAFTVLTVPVLIGLSGKEVGRTVWFSAAAALFGISLLTGDGGAPNIGDLFCVASAIFFGVHKWRGEAIVSGVSDARALVALQLALLGLFSVGLAVPEIADTLSTNGISGSFELAKGLPWGELMFMGVGTTALTLYIEMEALKDVSAATAALIYTSEPIWGATFAWILLSERWGLQGWLGGALVVAASAYSQLSGESEKLKYQPETSEPSNKES